MKNKLRNIICIICVLICTNISNVYAIGVPYNPIYFIFEKFFLVLVLIALLIITIVHSNKKKSNPENTKTAKKVIILVIAISLILYFAGLNIIPKYGQARLF